MVSETKRPYKWFTDYLREKMKDKAIRQTEIAFRLNASQPSISLYLRNPQKLMAQDKEFIVRFIQEHGFTKTEASQLAQKLFAQDFKEIFGTSDTFEKYAIRNIEEEVIPIYASASAGSGDSSDIEEYVRVPKAALKGHQKQNVYGVLVNGNCLVSHEVRFYAKNIAHGDYAFIDSEQLPKNNDVVLFWDNRAEKLIIKLYKESGSSIILYDAHGVMVPKAQFENDLVFKGVVFWRSGGTNI